MKFWHSFPNEIPPHNGKFLVELGCGDRKWVSIKCWEQVQVHHASGEYQHEIYPGSWILEQEFDDTHVLKWGIIPDDTK